MRFGRLVLPLLLTTAGCFAVTPAPTHNPSPDMAPAAPDLAPPPPPSFTVSATPQRTYWMSVPISGQGPASGIVIIQSTAGGAQTTPIGPDGQFCLDIPLKAAADNTITLRPQDTSGKLGNPVSVVVTQSGSPPSGQQGVPSQNVATWSPIDHSGGTFCGLSGDPTYANDGNDQTYFGITPCYGTQSRLEVHFGSVQKVEKAVIKYDSGGKPDSFDVYLSNYDVPGQCADNSSNWQKVAHADSAGTVNTVTFGTTNAQHICVLSQHSLNVIITVEVRYAEVEAWTQAFVAPPPPRAPTCGGVGPL